MPRRKKKINFNFILIALAIIAGTWISADYYFNVYQHPQKDTVSEPAAGQTAVKKESLPAVEKKEAAAEDGFVNETYRDDRYGFKFQYPVPAVADPECAKLGKTGDGLSLGIFSFSVSDGQNLADFITGQLEGMSVESRNDITVAGLPAVKVDYQTAGMGWYGSDTFVARGGRIYEFGLLANESSAKCNGVDDYEDRVYQSVIATLKFTN